MTLTQQQFDGLALFLYCWGPYSLSVYDVGEDLLKNNKINNEKIVSNVMSGFINKNSLGGHISRIYDIIELINEGDY